MILSNKTKETIDKLDGFITGNLIVDLKNKSVQLEVSNGKKVSYLLLTNADHIEVLNGDDGYVKVSPHDALEKVDHIAGCSIFAGTYARVKKGQ